MAYCTEAQIEGEFKSVDFGATTAVTSDDITRFIAETDAYIDGKIGLKYSVPVTGAISILILRTISIQLIKKRVNGILELKTGEAGKNQGSASDQKHPAEIMLDQIVDGTLLLSDATLLTSHDGIKDYNSENDIAPYFNVTQDQW